MNKSVGKEISILSRQFKIYITRELKDLDIMPSEYIFIVNIEKDKKTNQQDLCDKFVLDKSGATRAITSLVKKGFVKRERNPDDKREYLISLTDEGERIKPVIVERLHQWTTILQGDLNDEKLEEVINILEQFTENALKNNIKNN